MGTGPTCRGSPRAHQTLLGLTLLTLLLLVQQTNSQVYESWNYGRNQLMRKINDRLDTFDNSLREIKNKIRYIWNFNNIPLTHEERIAKLSCPRYFATLNATVECIHISNRYSTYKEATEGCKSIGGNLFVPKDLRLLGEFLMEIDSQGRTRLSHDIFWIGADNNIQPDILRWVDGRRVDVHTSVYTTEPGGVTDINPSTNLCGVLRLDKIGGDGNPDDNKLTVKPCEEPQRYPYLCEIDSGSESKISRHPSFREICPDGQFRFPTGECVYYSKTEKSLSYSEASNFCEAQGATLMHPRNLTFLRTALSEHHEYTILESNPTYGKIEEEYGIWLSNTVTSIDPDWNDMMQQSKQQENGEPGTDMCTLFQTRPSELEMYKGIASCSSSQRFVCSLNMHPKSYDMFNDGPYG